MASRRFERALLDPAGTFGMPDEVLLAGGVDYEEKREILRRWLHDARELAVADDEGMSGGEPPLLQRVTEALAALDRNAERGG
jgi:hypothetical protein